MRPRRIIPPALWLAIAVGMAAMAGPSRASPAATFTVDSTADAQDINVGDGNCVASNGKCTLRAAIQEANTLAGADTIQLPAGTFTLTLAGVDEDAALTGDLDITDDLTLSGADAATTIIDGNRTDRVFHILNVVTSVQISNVSIRNGAAGGFYGGGGLRKGGGIKNAGSLNIDISTISANRASDTGGGIYSTGPLSITNSAVIRNQANGNGGGIYAEGTTTIANTTVGANQVGGHGGGISSGGTVEANNITVTNNTADSDANGHGDGGGLHIASGAFSIRNSVVAGNHDEAPPTNHRDCSGTLVLQGYNLLQDTAGCALGGVSAGNQFGVDPLLDVLRDNGGLTQTHALLVGSPAVDAGNPATPGSGGDACEATDQRGVSRPVGSACDIGAYEGSAWLYFLPLIASSSY